MRLDIYLKVSRLIKRRTIANEACTQGRVLLNGRAAKPAADVKAGDTLSLRLGNRALHVRVLSLPEHANKANAQELYAVLEDEV
ncbi:MAG: RNA-binding S4 domain-containing protein [Clostridiales bacterium]|jgi:ribosomal 50S subunit-recycling heat shock protein|nr:RNA-binding S4 domain-containing protein [Clostridiales bacterium]